MNSPSVGEGVVCPSEEADQPPPELSIEETIAKWRKLLGPDCSVHVSTYVSIGMTPCVQSPLLNFLSSNNVCTGT